MMPSTRAPRFTDYSHSEHCSVESALEVIGGKWKGVILFHLLGGTLRFNDLRRAVGAITQRSLTKQLRELEADGVILREVVDAVPLRVEYSLTAKGEALAPVLTALREWGRVHTRPKQKNACG